MRLAAALFAALALATVVAACAERAHPQTHTAPKLWQTGTRAPTVTLTEPAGGPEKG